jgi:hypothetical protein
MLIGDDFKTQVATENVLVIVGPIMHFFTTILLENSLINP